MNPVLRKPFARIVALATLAVASTVASAQTQADLDGLLGRVSSATGASVVLVPPMSLFRDALDEVRMRQAGCLYRTADPATIASLVALLDGAHLEASPLYRRPDLREGVYFTLDDGTRIGFLFDDNHGGASPAVGVVRRVAGDDLTSMAWTARPALAADLRAWTAAHGGRGEGTACARQSGIAPAEGTPPP